MTSHHVQSRQQPGALQPPDHKHALPPPSSGSCSPHPSWCPLPATTDSPAQTHLPEHKPPPLVPTPSHSPLHSSNVGTPSGPQRHTRERKKQGKQASRKPGRSYGPRRERRAGHWMDRDSMKPAGRVTLPLQGRSQ